LKYWLSLIFEPVEQLIDLARMAEELDFEGVVLPDHIVVKVGERVPHPRGYPLQPDELFPDPFCAMSAMATATTRLRFMSGVYVVPLRDPFALAKQAGTLAVMSGNRFVLGTGVGWLEEEFQIVGRDFAARGRRMDEMLQILQDFWEDGYAEFHGEFFDFPLSGMFPVPTERIPIFIGGHSMAAARRAVHYDGYMPMDGMNDRSRAEFAAIDQRRAELGLDGPFERMVGGTDLDAGGVRELAEVEGITNLLVRPWPASDYSLTLDDRRRLAERYATDVMAKT